MLRRLTGPTLLGLLFVLGTTLAQPPGEDDDGPPPEKGYRNKGPKGPKGPGGFQLGKVLPPHLRDGLDLTDEQARQIAELEKQVRSKLLRILTEKQKRQLEGMGRPGRGGKGRFKGPRDDERGEPRRQRPGGDDGPGEKLKRPNKDGDDGDRAAAPPGGGIQWFATLAGARAEAARTGRPILLVSAAPHCAGVSGIW